MRSKLLNADPPVTYAVVLDAGDEVAGALGSFVRDREVEAASVTAIGAFSRALLGYFQWETKQYKKIAVHEQVEVLSLRGDVAVGDQGPTLHLHAVLGKADGSVVGGHLREAYCPSDPRSHLDPTAELFAQAQGPGERFGPDRDRSVLIVLLAASVVLGSPPGTSTHRGDGRWPRHAVLDC